jgi:hypothetical protein
VVAKEVNCCYESVVAILVPLLSNVNGWEKKALLVVIENFLLQEVFSFHVMSMEAM